MHQYVRGSHALPDFTFDLAYSVLVANGLRYHSFCFRLRNDVLVDGLDELRGSPSVVHVLAQLSQNLLTLFLL